MEVSMNMRNSIYTVVLIGLGCSLIAPIFAVPNITLDIDQDSSISKTTSGIAQGAKKVAVATANGAVWAIKHPVKTAAGAGLGYVTYKNGPRAVADEVQSKLISPMIDIAKWTLEHAHIVAPIAAVSTVAYLTYCRILGKCWKAHIKAARKITQYLENVEIAPQDTKLMFWKLNEYARPFDLAQADSIYCELFKEKHTASEENKELAFINRMNSEIDSEKKELGEILKRLNKCLQESHLMPEIKLGYSVDPYEIFQIVEKAKYSLGYQGRKLSELSKDEFDELDQEITRQCAPSLLHPLDTMRYLLRHYAFPYEAAALSESWKIYQLLERLETIKDILKQQKILLDKVTKI